MVTNTARYIVSIVLAVALATTPSCANEKLKRSWKRLKAFQARLKKKVVPALPKKTPSVAAKKVIKCPDGFTVAETVLTVRDGFLKKVLDPDASTRDSKYMPKSVLTSYPLRRMAMHPKIKPKSFRRHLKRVEKMKYIGVYLTEKYVPGKLKRKKIHAHAVFWGYFALYEIATGKLVTMFPLRVRSADRITAWKKRGYKANWARALRESLSKGAGQWTNKYLKKYCPGVRVDARRY